MANLFDGSTFKAKGNISKPTGGGGSWGEKKETIDAPEPLGFLPSFVSPVGTQQGKSAVGQWKSGDKLGAVKTGLGAVVKGSAEAFSLPWRFAARTGTQVGLYGAGVESYTPNTEVERMIMGPQPVKNIGMQTREDAEMGGGIGEYLGGKTGRGIGTGAGAGLGLVMASTDFMGLGGGKKIAKEVLDEVGQRASKNITKRIGALPLEERKAISSKPQVIRDFLYKIGSAFSPADDTVILFHGTEAKDIGGELRQGWLTPDYDVASAYGTPIPMRVDVKSLSKFGYDFVPNGNLVEGADGIWRAGDKGVVSLPGSYTGRELPKTLKPEVQGLFEEARKFKSAEEFVKAQQEKGFFYYHGSPTGAFGEKEIHVGTKRAAQQALEARIGIRADGKTWDGTSEYGSTLLAGKKTLQKLDSQGFNQTGFNVGVPEEDFYLKDYPELARAVFADGTRIPLTVKPGMFPVKIKGEMTNIVSSPLSDIKANATIKAMLKKGQAKRGYFYENIGEDAGSISAVVPSSEHLEKGLTEAQLTDIWNQAQQQLSFLYHGTSDDILDVISKEGLKPMRRGLPSLSKDEAYARNFAREGMKPQGKTGPALFRIKSDLLEGKTIPIGKKRPMSDQLNEVLTKETIPPEAIEVLRDGNWVPLKAQQQIQPTKAAMGLAGMSVAKKFDLPTRLPSDVEKRTLMAVHNTTASKLKFSNEIGGIPNPSLAIVNLEKGMIDGFGDITLIADKNLIQQGKTHASDVYSPRTPSTNYKFKNNGLNQLMDSLKPYEEKVGSKIWEIDSSDVGRSMENSALTMAKFLEEKGIS